MLKLKSVNFERQQFQNHCLEQFRPGQLEWVIGRSSNCDLVLPAPEVSRVHGRIVYLDDSYYFIDDGSTSGSLLNGDSIAVNQKHPIQTGDLLQIGETFVYVEALTPPNGAAMDASACAVFTMPEKPWTDEDLLCRCCRIVDETADVKTFYFVGDPPVLFSYKPGQFVNLEVEIDQRSVIRSYSISSSPTRPSHLSITVKRVQSPVDQPDLPAGLVSNWLHDHLKVGDRVKLVGGPMGQFTCLPNLPAKMLFISAGSGITPMMSMTRWVQDALAESDIIFLHSARTSEDIVFRAELESIAAQMPNFHLAVTLTQQLQGRSWMGLTGRISASLLNMVAPDLCERSVFVCGPAAFMEGTRTLLESMQFPMQNYQEESFGGKLPKSTQPKAAPEARSQSKISTVSNGKGPDNYSAPIQTVAINTAPVIHFLKSERKVSADETDSILEIAEQEGISIRHACRVGACGACKVRICQGKVRYDTPPMALTPTDQQAGYALACVAYPVDELAIEA